ALRKKPVTDALHRAADDVFSGNVHKKFQVPGSRFQDKNQSDLEPGTWNLELTNCIKAFHQTSLAASIDRHSAHREFARGGLPHFFREREKILRFVGFETDYVILLAKAERVRHVNFDVLEFLADHEILFDHVVALFVRHRVPV